MNPLQVKIFTYFTLTISSSCEVQVNKWLTKNPNIEIVKMLQSESMAAKNDQLERNMSITILYREV
jgi:hypothetical protein